MSQSLADPARYASSSVSAAPDVVKRLGAWRDSPSVVIDRAKFTGLLDTMRCREDVYENRQYVGGRLGISGVAHQNGTIRFGTDPNSSALNLDCRLHEVDNVYVADSSFFCSSTAVNPTLTIIANALRVAETVAQRLGRTTFPATAVPSLNATRV